MAKKDQDLSMTIGFEADKESLKEALEDVKKEIKREQKKGKATVKVSASANDNTDIDRVIHNKVKDPKKHDALSMLMSAAGGSWDRFATAADYHAGTFSPVQTRGKGGIIIDPEGGKTINAGGLVKHTNAVTDAVEAQIKRENAYARKHKLNTIKQTEQDDILAASAIHDRFKYSDTGKLNPNAMKDAASWAKIYGLDGAYGILSNPESRGARIISAVDYATSQESRWADMDENGAWKKQDFDVLDAAVKAGEGRWKDPDSAHVVDNFERINDATQEENENLEDWRDNLKGIIGDLGIIALLMKGMKAVMKFDKWSEQVVKSTAEGMPTRSNIGATTEDIHRMRAASGYLNLPQETIYNSVAALAERQGEFATTGKGLELFYGSVARGLEPILKNMNDPQAAWNSAMDLFLNELTAQKQAGNQQEIDKLLNSIRQFMGDEAATVLSRMLDFNFDTQSTNDVTSIAALLDKYRGNPYGNESERAEALNSELNTLRQSIQQSYNAMATDWMKYFGKPFREYWDSFLIDFIAWYRGIADKMREWNEDDRLPPVSGIGGTVGFAGKVVAQMDEMTPYRYTANDLINYSPNMFNKNSRATKYAPVSSAKSAKEVFNKLPKEMQDLIKSYAGGASIDFNDPYLWNIIMAADKTKNDRTFTGPNTDQINRDKANALQRELSKSNSINGYLGYFFRHHTELGINGDKVWTEAERAEAQQAYDKYLAADGNKELWEQRLKENSALMQEYRSSSLSRFEFNKTGLMVPAALDLRNPATSRFLATALSDTNMQYGTQYTSINDLMKSDYVGTIADKFEHAASSAGVSYDVIDYIKGRFSANKDAYKKLTDMNVESFEQTFIQRAINAMTQLDTSDVDKINLLNVLFDELLRQYGDNVGSSSDVERTKRKQEEMQKAGDVAINITVNGVDTNNANEVANAVAAEVKPALAAQTASVV